MTSRKRVVVVVSVIPRHMGMGSLTWLGSVSRQAEYHDPDVRERNYTIYHMLSACDDDD